ncbi:iron-sulfur cluster assembly scaffold protein [Kiritimatiellaeota bacterium B1221]|nr:iron-sulfur cluster assembly scaffold protein [Kiritimatiellaeota bacterium B1221]
MYEETLLQLSRDTRFRKSEALPHALSERRNPACGDEVALYGTLGNGKIEHLAFYAQSCAVGVASCAALCRELNGLSLQTAKERIQAACSFFDGDKDWQHDWGTSTLPALGAVRARPMRMTCVRLAWLALQDALEKNEGPKSQA